MLCFICCHAIQCQRAKYFKTDTHYNNKEIYISFIYSKHDLSLLLREEKYRHIKNETADKKVLLQSSHFGQRWLCCFQVAGPACLKFGRGFGTPIRVSTVILCHGFNITATPHSPTWDVIFFYQRRKAVPFILRYLRSNQEGERNSQKHILYCCNG